MFSPSALTIAMTSFLVFSTKKDIVESVSKCSNTFKISHFIKEAKYRHGPQPPQLTNLLPPTNF